MTTTLRDVLQFLHTATKNDVSRVREELRYMSQLEQSKARAEFRPGDKVQFKGRHGVTEKGVVVKKNPKMIVVRTEPYGERWRVAPTLLTKVEQGEAQKPGTLTETPPPPRTPGLVPGIHLGLDDDEDPPSE